VPCAFKLLAQQLIKVLCPTELTAYCGRDEPAHVGIASEPRTEVQNGWFTMFSNGELIIPPTLSMPAYAISKAISGKKFVLDCENPLIKKKRQVHYRASALA
jgi:hypothetical protein